LNGLRDRFDRPVRRSPPRRYRSDDYKRWFPKTARVFLGYLKRYHALPVAVRQEGRAVGVVVCPWVSTAAPWYSIMLAIGLARRGRNVVIVWDDTSFPERDVDGQNRVIGRVLSYVGRFFPVVRLSHQTPRPPSETDARAIGDLTDQNLAWRLRGAPPAARHRSMMQEISASLEQTLPFVRGALDRADLESLVVPGGVYGSSGLFLLAAAERGCRVATFDADLRVGQVCVGGVAAQSADVPRAFDSLWHSGRQAREEAMAVGRAEFERRNESRDRYGFQAVPADSAASEVDDGVLIPLNVEWDTAALGKRVHFESTGDWLKSTIAAVLAMDAGPVTVRQHPSERRELQRSNLDIASILRDRFGDERRCRFVAAEDPVNTYDLLRSARLVLPFVSTIGIEAAAIGKPVLMSGAAFYSDLGFVWSAESRDEYFELLRRGVIGELEPLPEQSDRAWTCYYLAAVRNRIWTDFTAQPDDFWEWCRRAPDSIFAEPEVSDILEAIDRDVPVSLLRHRRLSSPNG
jgi:hypothetical protein